MRFFIASLLFCLVASKSSDLLAEQVYPDCEFRVEHDGLLGWKQVEHLLRNGVPIAEIDRRRSRLEWTEVRFISNPIQYSNSLIYELRDSLEEDGNYVFFSHRSSKFNGTAVLETHHGSSFARVFYEGAQGKKSLSISYLHKQELEHILSDILCLYTWTINE